jgi:hypothetical protein
MTYGIWSKINKVDYNIALGLGAMYSATQLKYSGDIDYGESYSSFAALISFGFDVRLIDDLAAYYDFKSSVFGKDSFGENIFGLKYYF